MALNADRNTPRLDDSCSHYPMKGGVVIWGGGMVALESSGLAVPAADAAGLKVVGRAETTVDARDAVSEQVQVPVRRGVFGWELSATNAPEREHVFGDVYVEDDETVSTDGGTNSVVAGKLIELRDGLAWVRTE